MKGPLAIALAVLCVSTIAFYVWSVRAARSLVRRRPPGETGKPRPAVSILKPIRGVDPNAFANFSSFCRQDYPSFELLFGAEDPGDPGLEAARRLQREHPEVPIRIIVGDGVAGTNPKVRTLARLALEARHPVLLVSDSDIRAGRAHLARMVEPLENPSVGVVTCLYRSGAETFWGRMDGLGLSAEFVPGVLVAREIEGMTFAMGAGIAIRRDVLDGIGGFAAVAHSLADDYLLGNLPACAGHRVEIARDVVDHRLGTGSLRELLARQIRWNLTIRTSRPWSYAGLLFTQGTAAALALPIAAAGSAAAWLLAGATLAARIGAAWFVMAWFLEDRRGARLLWLLPLRDLLSTAAWLAAFFTRTVVWRGQTLRVGSGGRLFAGPGPSSGLPRAERHAADAARR